MPEKLPEGIGAAEDADSLRAAMGRLEQILDRDKRAIAAGERLMERARKASLRAKAALEALGEEYAEPEE